MGFVNRESFKIINNFGYLTIIQLFNLLFPLILYPYLIRAVGKELYGEVLFAQSIAVYFSLFINYGFNIYGTKEISRYSQSKQRIAITLGRIFCVQLFFYFINIMTILIMFSTTNWIENLFLYLFATYICFNEIAVPVWYFQGKEEMKYIAICSFFSKITSLCLIIILVRDSSDYIYILFAYFIGTLVCFAFSFYKIFITDKNRFILPRSFSLKAVMVDSYPYFISHALGGITSKSNSFLIGFFVGKVELAYYDLADKIINIISVFFQNFSNAIFPNVAKSKDYNLVKKSIKISFLFSIIIIIGLLFSSEFIISLLGGSDMVDAKDYLIMLSATLIFRAIGPIISTSILVVNGLGKYLGSSFLIAFIIYLGGILCLYTFNWFSVQNLIIIFILSLVFRVVYRMYILYSNNLKHWLV